MKNKYILSLDQGTTSSRAVLFNRETNNIEIIRSKPLTQIYPKPGWVEHDPIGIWEGQLEALKNVISDSGVKVSEIACIGITNQRETVVVWNRYTGKPIHNAIVWQCRRTSDICGRLKEKGLKETIQYKTGLVIDAYFSGTKIKWILDNVEGARDMAARGELLAGTIDTWLIWKLTGGKLHITDYSNASRTMLFNIRQLEWDKELLEELDIPLNILPEVVPSSGVVGETDPAILGVGIPISGIAGDQQSALFGQACFEEGAAKNTYGTGCFILMNTGSRPAVSANNLLTTIAWSVGGKVEYALEGSVFNAGSAIQWLRDEMKLIDCAHQADIDAETVEDTGGVFFVPAFTGLGAPYWDMFARGTITGITRGTKREHIIRATLEAIAYESRDVFEVMKLDTGMELKELKVDGGASKSPFLMQFQSDIMNINVKRPKIIETTALGAVYLAGLGSGLWKSRDEIADIWVMDKMFEPAMEESVRIKKYNDWKRAVERALKWEY